MKVLITGARGFLARNLIVSLENIISGKDRCHCLGEQLELYQYSHHMGTGTLKKYCQDCDFVFYLAGVNRPMEPREYMEGNAGLLEFMLEELVRQKNPCPVMYASSTQAVLDNEYGKSKRAAEELLLQYSQEMDVPVYIYRLSNVFGKWCRPNYNSVVATFCYNVARNLPIRVDAPEKTLQLVYIDDVVEEMTGLLCTKKKGTFANPLSIKQVYKVTLKEIADLVYEFKQAREGLYVPFMEKGSFSQRLYSTYLTYLPEDQLKYPVAMKQDERGSFTELFRTKERGQFSVNVIKPGIKKGEHWHHTKNEKFIVVSGRGWIRLRRLDSDTIWDFHVSGDKLEVIDIPSGYTHNIINEGDCDLVTVMWANECFDEKRPDTYYLKVEETED